MHALSSLVVFGKELPNCFKTLIYFSVERITLKQLSFSATARCALKVKVRIVSDTKRFSMLFSYIKLIFLNKDIASIIFDPTKNICIL